MDGSNSVMTVLDGGGQALNMNGMYRFHFFLANFVLALFARDELAVIEGLKIYVFLKKSSDILTGIRR